MMIYVQDSDLSQVLNTDKPTMVMFGSSTCGPCKMATPIVESVAERHGEYMIAKVDVEENEDLVLSYNIMKIPTFLFFKNGEKVDEMTAGDIRRSVMETKLKQLI